MKAAFIIGLLALTSTVLAQTQSGTTTAQDGNSQTTVSVAIAVTTYLAINPLAAVTTATTSSVGTLYVGSVQAGSSTNNVFTATPNTSPVANYYSYQVVTSYTQSCNYYPLTIATATNTSSTLNLLYACQTLVTSTYTYPPPATSTATNVPLTTAFVVPSSTATTPNPPFTASSSGTANPGIVYATTSVSFQYITYTNVTTLTTTPPVNTTSASYQIFNCTASTSVAPALTAAGSCTANITLTYVQTNTTSAIACFSSYVLATGGVVGSGVNTTMCYANLTSTYAGNTSAQVFAGINQIVNQTSVQITMQSPVINSTGVLASSTVATTTYSTTNASCSNIAVPSSCISAVNNTGNQTVYTYCLPVIAMVNATNQTFATCYANTTICSEIIGSSGTIYTALSCGATTMVQVNTTIPTSNTVITTKSASNIMVAIQCTLLMISAMIL